MAGLLATTFLLPWSVHGDDPKIHTVLPFDGIQAVFETEFIDAQEARLHPDSPVIGVDLNGERHAYSMILLNHHEIVNDVVGGVPVAMTW